MNASAIDPKAAKLKAAVATREPQLALAVDAAEEVAYAAGFEGVVYTCSLKADKPTAEQKSLLHENYVSGLALLPDAILSCGYDRKVNWTDRKTGKVRKSIAAHDGWIRKLALSARGDQVATIGDDMSLKIWDAKTGQAIGSMTGHEAKTPEGPLSALYALALSADGQHAATADRAGFVRIWDLKSRKRLAGFRAADFYTFDAVKRARAMGGIRGLAFSPDGARLAISGIGAVTNVDGFVGPCRIEVWDWKAEKRLAVGQDKHNAILNHVAFVESGAGIVAVGGGDSGGVIVFWTGSEKTPPVLVKAKGHLHQFEVLPGPRLVAAGSGGLQIWQIG